MQEKIIDTASQDITPQDLMRFFSLKNIDAKCRQCNAGTSSIQANLETGKCRIVMSQYATVTSAGEIAIDHNLAFPSAMVVCDNCGYMRHFSAAKINASLNELSPERVQA